jgi:hypothetical protein
VCGKGSTIRPPKARQSVVFRAPDAKGGRVAVTIRGAPKWLQSDENWGLCACDQTPFFLGRVDANHFGCGDQSLYVFACPACRTMDLYMQCT